MVGIAGQDASLSPFLFNQFYLDNEQISEDIAEGCADVWDNVAGLVGKFISWTFASSLEWNPAFKFSFIGVTVAYLLFCCGSRYYKRKAPTKETATSRMMQAKRPIKLIFLLITFIPYCLVVFSGLSLFLLQGVQLDDSIKLKIHVAGVDKVNRIPLSSLYLFQKLITFIISKSYDFVIGKLWSSEETMTIKHRAGFVRIGIGMLFAFGSAVSAWLVQVRIDNNTDGMLTLLWLAPQYGLLGIANGLIEKGMSDFLGDRLPQSMWFFVFPLTQGVFGIGTFVSAISILLARDWFDDTDNVKKIQLDKYFEMLAILNITILVVYIFLSYFFDWNITDSDDVEITQNDVHDIPIEEVGGRDGDLISSAFACIYSPLRRSVLRCFDFVISSFKVLCSRTRVARITVS